MQSGYDVLEGCAIKKYKPFDFDVADKEKFISEVKGMEIVSRNEKTFVLELTEKDFVFKIIGFDKNRDLKVKALKI